MGISRINTVKRVFVSIVMLAVLMCYSNYCEAATVLSSAVELPKWEISTIDDSVDRTFNDVSMKIDSNGFTHVVYDYFYQEQLGLSTLKYAYWNGEGWTFQIIESGIPYGNVSMQLDSNNRPHIAYTVDSDLKYCFWDGMKWNITTVYSNTGRSIYDISMDLDRSELPQICWQDWGYGEMILTLSSFDGTNWTTEQIDYPTSETPSMAIDNNNIPHICCGWDGSLKYTTKIDNQWVIQIVPGEYGDGGYASLKLDSNGNPHIAQQNFLKNKLMYHYFDGLTWHSETVESFGYGHGMATSLVLDSNNRPYISYRWNGLKYAFRDNNGTWNTQVVSSSTTGFDSNIDLDNQNNMHICYIDGTSLKYAVADTTIPVVNSTTPFNGESGLAIDTNVTFTFNEAVNEGSEYSSIAFKDDSNNVVTFSEDLTGNTLTLIPTKSLDYNRTYSVTLPANAVQDFVGKSLIDEYTLSFSTVKDTNQVAIPKSQPKGGIVPNGTQVTISTATQGADIYYTTDGTTPIKASTKYQAPIVINTATTIKALACKDSMTDSEVMTEVYSLLVAEAYLGDVSDMWGHIYNVKIQYIANSFGPTSDYEYIVTINGFSKTLKGTADFNSFFPVLLEAKQTYDSDKATSKNYADQAYQVITGSLP